MKKSVIVLATILSISMTTPAFAGIGVTIDGSPVNFTPSTGSPVIDENGRTLVPLRAAMEAYGCTVSWDKTSSTASVFKDGTVVQVPVGQKKVVVNGKNVVTDTQAKIISGRVYLPIRAVLEAFGASVGWNQTTQSVTVSSGKGGNIKPIVLPEKTLGTLQSGSLTAQGISEKCSPAVFFIKAYGFNGAERSTGSGFFISSDGLAVTNHHVIANSQYLEITTPGGFTTHDVKIIDYDKANDLALLKISGSNHPYLEMADSSAVKQGQKVYAIGSPLGLDNTMSQGIISNPSRVLDGTKYIQISVPIAPGSSGGALINEQGQAVGVTSAGFANSTGDLNLAIPISCVNKLDKTATVAKVDFSDDYYPGFTQVLDFGKFSGVELVAAEKTYFGYVLQYDAMDFYDVFETDAGSCYAYTLYYYKNALEERGLKHKGAYDFAGVYESNKESVEITLDLEDTRSIFVVVRKEPQVYSQVPALLDMGWYMNMDLMVPSEKIDGSWCYEYKWSDYYTYNDFIDALYEYIELQLESGYELIHADETTIYIEGYGVSAVFIIDKNKVFVDALKMY